jgi:hypothetical protein
MNFNQYEIYKANRQDDERKAMQRELIDLTSSQNKLALASLSSLATIGTCLVILFVYFMR